MVCITRRSLITGIVLSPVAQAIEITDDSQLNVVFHSGELLPVSESGFVLGTNDFTTTWDGNEVHIEIHENVPLPSGEWIIIPYASIAPE